MLTRGLRLFEELSVVLAADCTEEIVRSPQRGRQISSPQRELWVHVAKSKHSSRMRATSAGTVGCDDQYMSPLWGYGFWSYCYPQLALWAMDISLAAPTC